MRQSLLLSPKKVFNQKCSLCGLAFDSLNLSLNEVIEGIKKRPALTHVVLTGRSAKEELIQQADLVTEMKLIKHPFKEQGIKAQKCIEF